MIDIRLIRDQPEVIKENIKKRFQNDKLSLVDDIIKKDLRWRKLKKGLDDLKHQRNILSKQINEAQKKKESKSVKDLIKKAKDIPQLIGKLENKDNKLEQDINSLILKIPNLISPKTPIGKTEAENKVLKKSGKIQKFKFPVKNHVDLVEDLGIADFDASAKVSGAGFYYLKGSLALLNQALIRFAIDSMVKKRYEYIETPLMLNERSIYASMDKEAIESSVYLIDNENLGLVGTSEQPLLAMHSDQILKYSELPKKYFSYSICFRKEIGSHGINEKGLWRTHQFNKIEQFIFCEPEDSEKLYGELLKNSENILSKLKLPYRVIEFCSGALAGWKHRSADLDVYRPTTKSYEEVMSLSNCTDYQARKLNIRYLDKKGNRGILHTLNNTVLATSRIMVTILENYQLKDGTIKIPTVLQKYMYGQKKIES